MTESYTRLEALSRYLSDLGIGSGLRQGVMLALTGREDEALKQFRRVNPMWDDYQWDEATQTFASSVECTNGGKRTRQAA